MLEECNANCWNVVVARCKERMQIDAPCGRVLISQLPR